MAKILILEDDLLLRRDLKLLLSREGYDTESAADLKEARQHLLHGGPFDLFLLDVWLPDGDGFDLIKDIREKSTAPVIFLTANDNEASVIRGLDLGADDYITKPFRKAELLSRIAANLRRAVLAKPAGMLASGDLKLDRDRHEVYRQGELLTLRPAEYRLLTIFMENPGLLLSREKILTFLEEESFSDPVEDNTLSVHISRLRKKIGEERIETVRSFGYRFVG